MCLVRYVDKFVLQAALDLAARWEDETAAWVWKGDARLGRSLCLQADMNVLSSLRCVFPLRSNVLAEFGSDGAGRSPIVVPFGVRLYSSAGMNALWFKSSLSLRLRSISQGIVVLRLAACGGSG